MKKSKRYLFGPALLLAIITTSAMASQADFQSEVGYEYMTRSEDTVTKDEYTIHALSYSYYMQPVKIDNQPLAEAAFMNRLSRIAVEIGQFDLDTSNQTANGDFSFF